jgi:tetratricopeptide (TPR) repeat protein
LEVYLVSAAKPRAFRVKARGIEGIETRMIGREIELRLLQEALTLTLEDGETQVVTVVGEAGVGKSRLLFEFSNWTDLLDETVWFFQARATQPSMLQPYSLTRDLFSFRFQILDSDSLETVHDKFVDGVEGFLGGDSKVEAELIGQLVGFDFSDRPSVVEALKNADQFRTHALEYLGEFFTTASKMHPVVIHIEDIHWADDRSLDLINNLVRENTRLPLFVICMARPGLYERRPQWGEGQRFHERIQLEPLSQLSSRRLVKELLKKMPEIPSELRDLIVDRADGNPFYIEELIKALIDDGVIIKGEKAWGVDSTRLSTVRVPPTLTGVLQSRLDTLPTPLHQLLQRASVVGRMFWDAAAVHLSRDAGLSEDDLGSMLEDLREREMVLRREESSFAGTTEYVFRHAILRDVTYETIVPRHRRALHRLVGDWLLEMGGERAGEHTLLVAEHYTLAGEPALAAEHLRRAGEAATKVGAYEEALTTLHRALDLVRGEAHTKSRLSVQLVLGELHSRRGELPGAVAILEPMLSEARTLGDLSIVANVLGQLARISMWKDENEKAKQLLDEALPIVRQLDDQPALMFVLRQMGNLMLEDPEVSEPLQLESREIAKELGDVISEGQAVNGLGILAMVRGDYPRSLELFEESLGLFREAGDRSGESMLLGNIGDIQVVAGDFEAARRSLDESLAVARKIGDSGLEGNTLEVRARLFIDMGEDERAREDMRACLSICKEIDLKPMLLLAQGAVLEGRRGNHRRALEWVGFVRSRRAWGEERLQMEIDKRFDDIRGDLDEAEMAAALEHGATLDLDTVFARFHETYGTEDRAAAAPPDLSRPRP